MFGEIQVASFPVGHTHDIIDQTFGILRKWYYWHDFFTPDDVNYLYHDKDKIMKEPFQTYQKQSGWTLKTCGKSF